MRDVDHSRHTYGPTIKGLLPIIVSVALSALLSVAWSNITSSKPSEEWLFPIALILLILMTLLSIILLINLAKDSDARAEEWLQSVGRPSALHFEDVVSGTGKYYKVLTKALKSVSPGDKILIQTWHGPLAQNEAEARRIAREEYLKLLLEKANEEGVEYRRILCFDNPISDEIVPFGRVSNWLAEHCQALIELREKYSSKYSSRISVKTARTKIRADIVIIPGKIGCVVFDYYDNPTKKGSALFIFPVPPHRKIVRDLEDWFKEIDGDGARSVKAFILSPNPPHANQQVDSSGPQLKSGGGPTPPRD